MRTEKMNGSVDMLQDAMGLIEDRFLEEARPELNAQAGTKGVAGDESSAVNRVKADGRTAAAGKEQDAFKWKRRTRLAGMVAAAACVILIAAAVIFLPKDQPAGETALEAAADEAAAEALEAAADEAAAEDIAYEEAAEAAGIMETKAAADAGTAGMAEDGMTVSEEEMDGMANMNLTDNETPLTDGKGQAVAWHEIPGEESLLQTTATEENKEYCILRTADELVDFLERKELAAADPSEGGAQTLWGSSSSAAGEKSPETSSSEGSADAENLKENLIRHYTKEFFKEHALAVTFLELPSGAYELQYLYTEEQSGKAIQHYRVYRPDKDPQKEEIVVTADMADWMLLSEVSKDVTEIETVEEEYPYGF